MSHLCLIFNYQGKSSTLQCTATDTLNQVFNRYCIKTDLNIKDVRFYKNGKELKGCEKTLSALELKNNANIDVTDAKHVIGA